MSDVKLFPAGLSWTTASFRLEGASDTAETLIIKLGPDTGLLAPYSAMPQVTALRALQGSGVPVPQVRWYSDDPSLLGAPFFVSERVAGEPLNPFRRDLGCANEQVRRRLALAFTDALARMHQCDWRTATVAQDPDPDAARSQIGFWHERMRTWARGTPQPLLETATAWLLRRRPETQHMVLVHGDHRPGNFLVHNDEISAVLDWEMVHAGDPHEDLGWTIHPDFSLARMIDVEEFLARYAQQSGIEVSRAALAFYGVFNLYKFAIITLGAIRAFESGSPDVRMAVMGMNLPRQLQSLARAMKEYP